MSPTAPIAQPTALALALLLGPLACSDSTQQAVPDLAPPSSDPSLLVVATSDFTMGALSTVEVGSRVVHKKVDAIDSKPVVRALGSKVYVLDQTHGSVRAYDVAQNFQNPLEFPTSQAGVVDGTQANPHDIWVDGPRNLAYVSLYGSLGGTQVYFSRSIGVIDLAAPKAGITRFIALTQAPGDTDANPEADRMIECNGTLYVLLQDLDRNRGYVASGTGRLAVISVSNPDTPRYIQLAGENPIALAVLPGCTEAIVGSAADQFGGTLMGLGGIERVDLVANKTLGLALSDMQLGGNVSALDALDAAHVFADLQVKSGAVFNNTVYAVDMLAKKKGAALLGPLGFVPAVSVLGSHLAVLSAGSPGAGQLPTGLYLGTTSGAPLTDPALDVGLPPQSVALVYR